MAQACADACREYLSSLEDLTFNSKPHINMLTILAEENLHAAKDIVAIIEAQISKAPAAEKLPVLYLVDSIVKNVGGEYLDVFAKNLVTSFICVFEKVDEGTRKSLFKLRSTWDDVFPLKKLYALDVRVNSVDPAWPIKPLPPTVNASSIHVNPRFLVVPQTEESSPRASPPRPSVAPPPAPPLAPPPPSVAAASLEASLTQEQLIRQQLLAKQKQLLELQQKKIELELEQTKAQLAGNFVLNPPPIPPPPSQTPPGPAAPPPGPRDPRLTRDPRTGSNRSKDQVSAPSSTSPGVRPKEAAAHRPKDHAPQAAAHRPKDQSPQAAAHRPKDHTPLASAPRPAPPRFNNKEHQAGPPPTRAPAKREAGSSPTERRVGAEKQKGGGVPTRREAAASSEHQKSKSKSPSPAMVPPPKGRGSDIITPPPPKVRGSDIITPPPPKVRGSDIITPPPPKGRVGDIISPPPAKGRSNEPSLLKKDPRLPQRKRVPEKTGEDDIAKKRQIDRKEREEVSGGGAKKLANGSLGKREQHGQSGERGGEQLRGQSSERGGVEQLRGQSGERGGVEQLRGQSGERGGVEQLRGQSSERGGAGEQRGQSSERGGGELKTGGGNARTNARKRSRSPTPPPFPSSSSPKRKERRRSPSPSSPGGGGGGKTRRPVTPRKRTKRPPDGERDSPRVHHSSSSSSSDAKEPPLHSRRSAWEESKHLKQSEEAHGKCGPQRHVLQKSYSTPPPARPPHPGVPRTPKHRLSVDANLQIPDVLNSASKRDLLRRASRRLESGEISQEDFLNVAHQIKQLFQYREENKMAPPPGAISPSPQALYYQHKSKLRRTQLASNHQGAPQRCSAGEEEPDDEEEEPEAAARLSRERERTGERSSKEREEHHTPMIEEYNHGKDFPSSRKALQSLPRFRRKADLNLRDTAEREWTSPLSERQRYEERSGGERSGYDAPLSRRLPPPHHTPPPPPPPRTSPSPSPMVPPPGAPLLPSLLAPLQRGPSPLAFERERLSSPLQTDSGGLSPAPRFESPNSVHSDDVEASQGLPHHHHLHHPHPDNMETTPLPPAALPRSILKVRDSTPPVVPHTPLPPRPRPPPAHHYDNGPSHPPQQGGGGRFDEPLPHHHQGPMRGFDGPQRPPIGQQQQQPRRFDEHFDGPMRRFQQHRPPMQQHFDGPAHMGPGPIRFDGPNQPGPMRFEGPNQPMRFDGPGQPGPMRFDAPNQPQQMRFDAPNQSQPMRFEAPNQPQPMRFEAPNQAGPMRFESPNQPQPMRFEAPNQPQPMRFEAPNQPQPMMFEGQGQPGPMAGPGLRFDMSNHQQQPFHQPMVMQQQHFEQPPPRFPSGPHMGPMGGPMGGPPMGGPGPGPFSSMPGLQYQPGPFPGPSGPGFYNPGPPQQVNMVNMTQAFLPQNTVPFTQTAPPVAPDSHFGQIDVNELLTKLMSTGIIPAAAHAPTHTAGSTGPSPSAPVEEEEEEEEDLDDNIPDITSFNMDDLKQRYEPVVVKLYTGIQCYSCGMRFTSSQTDVYADHLDWHYRHNRSEKDVSRKVTHRRWYYSLTDWIEFEEVADLEERSKSLFFEKVNEEEVQKSAQEASKQKDVVSSVKAATDVVDESCEICAEPFEMYWEEEEEEWHLKNAIRVDDKTYHPSCYEDYKNTCSFGEATPSPSTASNQHPLSAFKQEDTPPSSCQFAGKQEEEMEAEEEGGGVKEIKQEVVEEEEEVASEEAGL